VPSFDVVCKPNLVELHNAVDQANREISNRFDFKGSDARVELAELEVILYADDEFKLGQVRDVLLAKLAKRSVDARFLNFDAPPQKIASDKLKQEVTVRSGLETVLAKRIVATRSRTANSSSPPASKAMRSALPVPRKTSCRSASRCCAARRATCRSVSTTSGTEAGQCIQPSSQYMTMVL